MGEKSILMGMREQQHGQCLLMKPFAASLAIPDNSKLRNRENVSVLCWEEHSKCGDEIAHL